MKRLFKKLVALGLAAAMTMGIGVTSFAADGEDVKETVGVSGTFYTDAAKKTQITEGIEGAWMTGSKKAEVTVGSSATTDLSKTVIYTATAKDDKVVVGVTDTTVTADKVPYSAGKFTNGEAAAKIAKAAYKFDKNTNVGAITVTPANKAVGDVRVWMVVYDATDKAKPMISASYVDVTVKAAANKVTLTIGESVAKKISVAVGSEQTITINGEDKLKKATTDATYIVKVDEKYEDNISAVVNDKGELVVEALSTKDVKKSTEEKTVYSTKPVATKVDVYCAQSMKKVSLTVNVTNPATGIAPAIKEGEALDLLAKKDSTIIELNAIVPGEGMLSTDTIKVYAAAPAAPAVDADPEKGIKAQKECVQFGLGADGKITKFTKSKAVNVKDNKDGTITLTRNEIYADAEIWVAYTDPASKQIKIYQVCYVEEVVPTQGDINIDTFEYDATDVEGLKKKTT